MSQEQPSAFSPDRVALRERHQLRVVGEAEEGRNILNQPNGVYGFTTSPSSEELPIFIKPVYQCTEIHKAANGDVFFLGYVTAKEKTAFEAGIEPVSFNLFPEPYGESKSLIALPENRIDRRKPPTRDNGNYMPVDVAPSPSVYGAGPA